MRNDKTTEYQYAKASSRNNPAGRNSPSIEGMGNNDDGHPIVTMFVDNNMGSKLYEYRHGGQHATRQQGGGLDVHNKLGTYDVSDEVSAYKAQYSWNGSLDYIDASSPLNQTTIKGGVDPGASTIDNIQNITSDFVKTKIGEVTSSGNDKKLTPLYENLR